MTKYMMILLSLAMGGGVWYWQSLKEDVTVQQSGALAQALNQCDLIAGKAASHLPEVLPFQKLEKAARQARVLERCMQDRGFEENPRWASAATRQAVEQARIQQISENEAYETLRRAAMLAAPEAGDSYWRQKR